jgi:hypothetical protein
VNLFYPVAINQILSGDLDLLDAPLMVQGFLSVYYDPSHTVRSDIYGSPLATPPVALTGRTVANRKLLADSITFAAVSESEALAGMLIYRGDDDGLVAFVDQRPDLAPIYVGGNGGPVVVTWAGIDRRAVFSL